MLASTGADHQRARRSGARRRSTRVADEVGDGPTTAQLDVGRAPARRRRRRQVQAGDDEERDERQQAVEHRVEQPRGRAPRARRPSGARRRRPLPSDSERWPATTRDHAVAQLARRRCSGETTLRSTPVPSSRPGGWVEAREDVDLPAEVLGAARRGADPEVQRRRAPKRAAGGAARRAAARRRAGRRPRSGPRRGAARAAAGRARARRTGASSTASSSIATMRSRRPHLLLHEVGEQVAAHRADGVGAEALALAGDERGDEVQGVELGVGVRQRGAALGAAR